MNDRAGLGFKNFTEHGEKWFLLFESATVVRCPGRWSFPGQTATARKMAGGILGSMSVPADFRTCGSHDGEPGVHPSPIDEDDDDGKACEFSKQAENLQVSRPWSLRPRFLARLDSIGSVGCMGYVSRGRVWLSVAMIGSHP